VIRFSDVEQEAACGIAGVDALIGDLEVHTLSLPTMESYAKAGSPR